MIGGRDLFGLPVVAARRTDTSRAAARSMDQHAGRLREMVLRAIRRAGAMGLTAHEAAAVLRLSSYATAPRCTELAKAGQVRDSGQRRANASGRKAIVSVIQP